MRWTRNGEMGEGLAVLYSVKVSYHQHMDGSAHYAFSLYALNRSCRAPERFDTFEEAARAGVTLAEQWLREGVEETLSLLLELS